MATVEAPLAEVLTFGTVRIPREYTITQQGREYILSDGLLVGLEQLSRGYYDVETTIVQLPTAENAQTAVVRAVVVVFDPDDGRVLRRATGLGDANPGNVGRMVAGHVLRMAETRALARSLRHILGCGMTALEELGPGGAEGASDAPTPAPAEKASVRPSWATPAPPETIQLEGRTFTRAQVLGIYGDRLAEAQRVGLMLAAPGTPGGPPLNTAPLPEIVKFSTELKRRLTVRAGAEASGK